MDVSQFQFNKMFGTKDTNNDGAPSSLLDCFLRQDETIYTQKTDSPLPIDQLDPPLPVDQVFMDSRALVSFSSNVWQEHEAAAPTGVMLKEEAKQSVMAVIDSLEKLTKSGDFDTVLQHLEVDDAELTEWDNCLKRFHQEEEPQRSLESELDDVITDDIIDFIDSVFKEKEEHCLQMSSCLTEVGFSAPGLQPQMFQAHDGTYSPVSSVNAHREGPVIGGQSLVGSAQMFSANQNHSHQSSLIPSADGILPPLQQLQLQDIFCPSIELPEFTVPKTSINDNLSVLQSCWQASVRPTSCFQSSSVLVQQPDQLLLHQNSQQSPAMTGASQFLQSSVPQPSAANVLPALVPCSQFSASHMMPVGHRAPCLQRPGALEKHNGPQLCSHSQLELPYVGTVPNGHETIPTFQSQNPHNQTFPSPEHWAGNVRLNQNEQGRPADPNSSCMFEQQFSSGPAGEDNLSRPCVSMGQYPPQSSYYFQWSHQPGGGHSTTNQENTSIHHLTAPSMASAAHLHHIQHNVDSNTQTQVTTNTVNHRHR